MKKRTLACFLALIMAGSTASCASDEPITATDTTAPTEDTTAEKPAERSGVPDDVDFEGETVTILNGYYMEKQVAYLDIQENTGDILNDAIYNRNLAVMENLGVKLEIDNLKIWDQYSKVRTTIQAGEDAWDFIMGMQYRVVQLTPEGMYTDLIDAPYIDITKPWWSTQFIENLNLGDKHRYLLCGDYSIGHLNQASAMYFNKAMYKDYYKNPDEMYDFVLDGKWTMDKLYELSSGVSKDVNGDTKLDYENDIFGLGVLPIAFTVQHLLFDAGAELTQYENDEVSLLGTTERNVAAVENVYKLIFENSGCLDMTASYNDGYIEVENAYAIMFPEDRLMFVPDLLAFADKLREMESDYGIVPYPKMEEDDDYRALVHNQSMTLAVPVTNTNLDMTSAVMEEMAYLGYRDMMPEYYETVLKQKYMRDGQDKAMQVLDIIHDNLYTEFGFTYDSFLGYCKILTSPAKGDGNIASKVAELKGAADTKLANLVDFFLN